MRRRSLGLLRIIISGFLVVVLLPSFLPGQTVVVEHKRKLLRGAPGEKPIDVTRHLIPLAEIEGGSPARNAIPALVDPRFIRGDQAGRLLSDSDRVLGVFLNGQAKAYPVRILNWHELVNDVVGGRPVLVTW